MKTWQNSANIPNLPKRWRWAKMAQWKEGFCEKKANLSERSQFFAADKFDLVIQHQRLENPSQSKTRVKQSAKNEPNLDRKVMKTIRNRQKTKGFYGIVWGFPERRAPAMNAAESYRNS